MKASEIKEFTEMELRSKLQETERELFNLRMQQSSGQLEKPSRIRELRKDVARINTIISARAKQTRAS